MPDNVLRVGAEFDVGPIISGTREAQDAFDRLAQATINNVRAQEAVRNSITQVLEATGEEATDMNALANAQAIAAQAAAVLSQAQKEVAAASGEAAASMSSAERAAAMLGGRLAGAEAGLGMMGFGIGRLAAALPALGLAFEIALPVLLIAAFIPKIEELMKADQELADATHAVEEASAKQNDELMKLGEEYTKITSGPLAAYAKELADLPLLSLNVTAETEKLNKQLEDQSHWYTEILAILQRIGIEQAAGITRNEQIATAAAAYAYTANDAEKAVRLINDHVLQNRDLSAAINAINQEIVKAETSLNAEKTSGRTLDAGRTQQALDTLNLEKTYLETEQKIVAAKAKNIQAEAAKTLTEETVRQLQAEEKIAETVSKTAAVKQSEEINVRIEQAKVLPELTPEAIDAKRKMLDDLLDQERTAQLVQADEIYQIKFAESQKEVALYHKGTEEYQRAVLRQAEIAADYDLQIAEINRSMNDKKAANDREYEQKWRAMIDRQAVEAENLAERMATLEVEEQKRAIEDVNAADRRGFEERQAQLKAAMTGLGGGAVTDALKDMFNDEQLKEYNVELQRVTQSFAQAMISAAGLRSILAAGGTLTEAQIAQLHTLDAELSQFSNLMGQIRIKQIQLQAEMQTSWQQIGAAINNAVNVGFNTFNSKFVEMMQTGESFGKVMIGVWNSMVASFVTAVLKMGEQWIATELLKLETTQTTNAAQTSSSLAHDAIQRLSAAKTAAAKAMASTPFPLDLIVGPIVFAAALAFRQGGIVPGSPDTAMPIVAHGREMVLPSDISVPLQAAIPSIANFNRAIESGISPINMAAGATHKTLHNNIRIEVNQMGGKMSTDEISAAVQHGIRTGILEFGL